MKSFILFLLVTLNVQAQPVVLSFENLRHFLEINNGDVGSAKLNLKAQENREGYLRRKFIPTFMLEAGTEKFSTGPYNNLTQPYGNATINMNLFNGRRDSFNNQIIQDQIEQKKMEYSQILMNSLLKLRTTYWEYLYEKEVIQILNMALENNEKNLSMAMLRIKGGIATRTDQIEFEQNALQVNQDLQRAQIEMTNLEREIKALILASDEVTLVSSENLPHEHSDDLLSDTFHVEKHRDNQWLNFQSSIVEQQRKLEKNWWTPSFDIYASAAHFTQKDRDYLSYEERSDFTLGIKLTMNIFDGGESYNQSKSYYLQRFAVESQSSQKRKELSADYKNAQALLKLTHEQIHSAEENVKKSEDYYRNTMSEYSRGIKNSPDVLGATQRIINARLRLIELKKDYQISRATLMNILGI